MKVILGMLNNELLINLASRAGTFCSQVDAAVAYAQGSDHPLLKACKEKGLKLTFYGLLDEDGAVGVPFLKELLAWGPSRAEVRLVKGNFHPKVIWWRGFGAYVGSANLTHKAWFNNVEAGVFFEEAELISTGAGAELDDMFEYLSKHSIPVTNEVIEKLDRLTQDRRPVLDQESKLKAKFSQLFGHLPENPGLTVKPPKGVKENKALKRFTVEWMATLQLMRGLAREFAALKLRPTWVDPDAQPAIHFDQFLHAYYYDYVRGGLDEEEDEELSGVEKVEASFAKHRSNPAAGLKEAAKWWASLPTDVHGEEAFIRETAPDMQKRLSREAVKTMGLPEFTEAVRYVNAFRMHARQVKNADFGLPVDHHENIEQRVNRLCAWLWEQRTPTGKTVRDVLEFVLWGSTPSDMEQRLWLGVWSDDYRLSHFGQSSLGEAVGWARPDEYPPRNNRTNKALRALGHDVKLFGKG
jgi:hypothetical protein